MSSNDPIQQAINQASGSSEIEVSIPGTPQKFKGATERDVIEQLVQAQQNATMAIQQARADAQSARQEVEGLRTQMPPPPPPNASDAEKQNYFQMWAVDPDKAFDAQLARRLNVSPERVPEVLRRAVENSTVNSAADEFLGRCPDFPMNPQNAAMMKAGLDAKYGTTMEAATADNLEVVYHQLVREGRIQPAYIPAQGFAQQNTVMPNIRGNTAPPNPVNDIMQQVHDMPLDKLKETLERLSAQGVR